MPSPYTPLYREIPLTKGQVALVDAEDFEWLNQWKWSVRFDKSTGCFYAQRYAYSGGVKQNIIMARLILGLEKGDLRQADHVDTGNTLDNRRFNLRIATQSQNNANRRIGRNNTSGFKG